MQTSINTIIVMALDSIKERQGMTGSNFSSWIGISPSSWSKATKGLYTINIESIHRLLKSYRHDGASGLSEFFGIVEDIISIITVDGDDPRSVLVRGNNLTLDKMWDTLLHPELLSSEVIDVISDYETESKSSLNIYNMSGEDDLFTNSSSVLHAQEEDYLEIYNYIDRLPWYEKDKKDPDWVISLKEKIKEKMRLAMKVDAEIMALKRKGKDSEMMDAIREMTRLAMINKVIGDSGNFDDSDAKKAIEKMKSNFHK